MAVKEIKEMWEHTKGLVCVYSGVKEEDLLTSNKEDCVDARYILIGVLAEYLTDDEISKLSGLTRSCCNKIRNGMRMRLSRFSFRCFFYSVNGLVKEWCETNLQ